MGVTGSSRPGSSTPASPACPAAVARSRPARPSPRSPPSGGPRRSPRDLRSPARCRRRAGRGPGRCSAGPRVGPVPVPAPDSCCLCRRRGDAERRRIRSRSLRCGCIRCRRSWPLGRRLRPGRTQSGERARRRGSEAVRAVRHGRGKGRLAPRWSVLERSRRNEGCGFASLRHCGLGTRVLNNRGGPDRLQHLRTRLGLRSQDAFAGPGIPADGAKSSFEPSFTTLNRVQTSPPLSLTIRYGTSCRITWTRDPFNFDAVGHELSLYVTVNGGKSRKIKWHCFISSIFGSSLMISLCEVVTIMLSGFTANSCRKQLASSQSVLCITQVTFPHSSNSTIHRSPSCCRTIVPRHPFHCSALRSPQTTTVSPAFIWRFSCEKCSIYIKLKPGIRPCPLYGET
jgi:hypothetical protein